MMGISWLWDILFRSFGAGTAGLRFAGVDSCGRWSLVLFVSGSGGNELLARRDAFLGRTSLSSDGFGRWCSAVFGGG